MQRIALTFKAELAEVLGFAVYMPVLMLSRWKRALQKVFVIRDPESATNYHALDSESNLSNKWYSAQLGNKWNHSERFRNMC